LQQVLQLGWSQCARELASNELMSIDYSHSGNLTWYGRLDSGAIGGPKRVGGGAFFPTGSVNLS